MNNERKALFIGAHPDDIELGCGGSLYKLIEAGWEVAVLILSRGEYGTSSSFNRIEETTEALGYLGVNTFYWGEFDDTKMYLQLKEIILKIEWVIRSFGTPDRVYTMFQHDAHQDHRTVFEASIVACRNVKQVLQYETPSSWPNFMPTVYEELTEQHMACKQFCLKMHRSQAHREYTQEEALAVSSKFRGNQVRLGPCEGFIPYKLVL